MEIKLSLDIIVQQFVRHINKLHVVPYNSIVTVSMTLIIASFLIFRFIIIFWLVTIAWALFFDFDTNKLEIVFWFWCEVVEMCGVHIIVVDDVSSLVFDIKQQLEYSALKVALWFLEHLHDR